MLLSRREVDRRLVDPSFTGSFEPSDAVDGPLVLARQIVSRDRVHVRLLAVAAALAWLAATTLGVWVAYLFVHESQEHFIGSAYRLAVAQDRLNAAIGDADPDGDGFIIMDDQLTALNEQYEEAYATVNDFSSVLMFLTQGAVLLAGIAALLSVWLVLASRRATLKQINVGLASVSDQLRLLTQAPAP